MMYFFQNKFIPAVFLLIVSTCSFAQNPNIKCYFNHPVNTSVSSGANAVYLNGTFDDTVAAYIDRAKYTVDIAQYNFTSTASSIVAKIATSVNNAFNRGVVVRWIYNGSSGNSGLSLLNPGIKTLGSPTTSGYGIMHDKFMIIDANSATASDAILMTSSYDWSTQQTNYDFNNIVVIQDQPISIAFYNEFNKMWGGTGSQPNISTSTFGNYKTPSTQTSFNVNGTVIELYFSPKDAASTHLKNAINTADHELFFGIYTFTDYSVANAIKTKINSGVAAKGIIDQFSQTYSPYPTLKPLMGNNLILYTGSDIYHNKMMVIDADHPASDPQVFTGSYNWSNAGTNTNDENTIIIHDSSVANQYLQSLCQNFADLGGAACVSALPLRIVYFTGIRQQQNTLLQWSVADADALQYFEVDKSHDGTHFTAIASVTATHQVYGYTDENAGNGVSYYRLRMIDKEAHSVYSNIIQVTPRRKEDLVIYPNPVTDHLFVQLQNVLKNQMTIQIADVTGHILQQQTVAFNPGMTTVGFNTTSLAKGIYFLNIVGNDQHGVRFIKQ